MSAESDGDWRAQTEGQVRATFERYEQALRAHAVATVNEFFVASGATVRLGIHEESYGSESIAAYRRAAAPVHPQRQLQHTVIAVLTADVACVSTEFTDPETPGLGRQSQTWLKTADGWKIAMAHVSVRTRSITDLK